MKHRKKHIRKSYKRSDQDIIQTAKSCETLAELRYKDFSAYVLLSKRSLLKDATSHFTRADPMKFTITEALVELEKYESISDIQYNNYSLYNFLKINELLPQGNKRTNDVLYIIRYPETPEINNPSIFKIGTGSSIEKYNRVYYINSELGIQMEPVLMIETPQARIIEKMILNKYDRVPPDVIRKKVQQNKPESIDTHGVSGITEFIYAETNDLIQETAEIIDSINNCKIDDLVYKTIKEYEAAKEKAATRSKNSQLW